MQYLEEEINLIVADSFKELTYRQKKLFLLSLAGGVDCGQYFEELIKSCTVGVYNKLKEKFYDPEYRQRVVSALDKAGVYCLTCKSLTYPDSLKNIPVPPLVLYLRGNAELLKGKAFAVVGSRKTTPQALELCKRICEGISKYLTLVTGVADGVDQAAARSAIKNGNAICVLPCGHGANTGGGAELIKEAEKSALTVSEFPPFTPAQRYTFLLRNRIIAALSLGVLVVSAAKKSGALSTAAYAADYGKDVFAFPYSPGVPSGEGCNALIKGGASLCDCEDDILDAYSVKRDRAESKGLTLDDDERLVLNLLKEHGELHAEKLASLAGKKPFEIAAICSMLEITGLIVRLGGNKFAAL